MYKLDTTQWYIERILYTLGGTLVFLGLTLYYLTDNNYWLLIPLFISLMLINFGLTGYCPAGIILEKIGFKGYITKK